MTDSNIIPDRNRSSMYSFVSSERLTLIKANEYHHLSNIMEVFMDIKATIKVSCPKCKIEYDHNYTADDFKSTKSVTFTCRKCGYTETKSGKAYMQDFKDVIAKQWEKEILKKLK